jgi:dihydropyrimidinase
MTPPIRTKDDQHSLWQGLADDVLDTIGTDHTPVSIDEKKAGTSLWEFAPGYPAVGTHLPSLLDSAQMSGFPLLKLIEKITAAPARIFGIYPGKGTMLPGSDADLVLIDPTLEKTATPEATGSRSDFCLHQGRRLKGWPAGVVKSGQMVTVDTFGRFKGSIKGCYLNRSKKT